MQLLRMVALGGRAEEAVREERCQVTGELLDTVTAIPTIYLSNCSMSFLHSSISLTGQNVKFVYHLPRSGT